jgi:thymidylate synthase (FAD)
MGSDLDVVNAARVSYDKSVDTLDVSDQRLLEFLIKHKHDSTLRHCVMTFEVYAPLMVARQWYKHAIASTFVDDQNGWNESSRRYVTEEPEFYLPEVWRAAPENKKQGSGDNLSDNTSNLIHSMLKQHVDDSVTRYKQLLQMGVAPEQARIFLPAYGMYVRWRWTVSLNAVLNFCALRVHETAQSEIMQYANAVADMVHSLYPSTYSHYLRHRIYE